MDWSRVGRVVGLALFVFVVSVVFLMVLVVGLVVVAVILVSLAFVVVGFVLVVVNLVESVREESRVSLGGFLWYVIYFGSDTPLVATGV